MAKSKSDVTKIIIAMFFGFLILGGAIFFGIRELTVKDTPRSEDVGCTYDAECGTNMLCRNGICTQSTPTVCPGDVTPALDVRASDRFTGQALDDYSFLYKRQQSNGVWGAWQTAYTGNTNIASSPGDKLQVVLLANNTLGYGVNSYQEYTVPCLEDPELNVKIGLVATASSMSVSVWNQDGSVNGASNAQAFTTSDTKNVCFEVVGHYNKQYGVEKVVGPAGELIDEDGGKCSGSILVLPVNRTVFADVSSSDLETTYVAEQVAQVTGYDYYAFKILSILSNAKATGSGEVCLALETDTTVEPTILHNLTGTFYDCQVYQNSKNYNNIEVGPEDYTGDDDIGQATELTISVYTS